MSKSKEFSSTHMLHGKSGRYFPIPASIICASEVNEKRVSVFSFFSVRRGLDAIVHFSNTGIVEWLGKKPDHHVGGINEKVNEIVAFLAAEGYLIYENSNTSRANSFNIVFDLERLTEECAHERFAIIYLDELDQIINYRGTGPKDVYMNADVLLLVFSYLRMKIYRRKNELLPEEVNYDNKNSHSYDIEVRKKRAPEAYDCYIYEIAQEIGLSARVVSKAIGILNDMELIYSEELPRIRYNDGTADRWRTDHTIFCNRYKREEKYLLASGKNYYLSEVKNKKIKLGLLRKAG